MLQFEEIFPTPVSNGFVYDNEILKDENDQVIDDVKFFMIHEWGHTHLITTDFVVNNNIIAQYNLTNTKQEIDRKLKEYCEYIDFPFKKDYKIESWFSKFEKGHYAHTHSHGIADISGVYYYKTQDSAGQIFFEPPAPQFSQTKCYYSKGKSLFQSPDEGKILLFPGWLSHGVTTNVSDTPRISLSFNIFFD